MKMYGIKNCDTVKKAVKQLDMQGTEYLFVDLKTTKLSKETIQEWLLQQPDLLINKRSTTYRTIKEDWLKAASEDEKITLIINNPTLIKRPILVQKNGVIIIGFDKATYEKLS